MSKTSTTVAVVAVLTAATLVVALTLAATISPSAAGHGNTVTKIISSNRGSASGHGQVINQCTFNGQHAPC